MVSVVIPTFNRAALVGKAIQSVLDQSYDNWELIVVDDGSTDNTLEVVAGYSDARLRYIYQENRKLPGARNRGIRASSGQFVAFLDSDDRFLPNKLSEQVSILKNDPDLGLVASGWIELDYRKRTSRPTYPWRMRPGLELSDWLHGCPFIVPAVLVRKEWLMRVNLFDEEQTYVEDWDLWLRLSYAGCKMAWHTALVCERTIHDRNMVHDASGMINGRLNVLDKFFAQERLSDSILERRATSYAGSHLSAGARLLGAGLAGEAQTHLQKAVALQPTLLDGAPPALLQSMASTALTHQVKDKERFVSDLCAILPGVDAGLARSERQLRAMIRATAAFEAKVLERRWEARGQAMLAIMGDPVWLSNRGLLRILLDPR